jgi:hypothetical protein
VQRWQSVKLKFAIWERARVESVRKRSSVRLRAIVWVLALTSHKKLNHE